MKAPLLYLATYLCMGHEWGWIIPSWPHDEKRIITLRAERTYCLQLNRLTFIAHAISSFPCSAKTRCDEVTCLYTLLEYVYIFSRLEKTPHTKHAQLRKLGYLSQFDEF